MKSLTSGTRAIYWVIAIVWITASIYALRHWIGDLVTSLDKTLSGLGS